MKNREQLWEDYEEARFALLMDRRIRVEATEERFTVFLPLG